MVAILLSALAQTPSVDWYLSGDRIPAVAFEQAELGLSDLVLRGQQHPDVFAEPYGLRSGEIDRLQIEGPFPAYSVWLDDLRQAGLRRPRFSHYAFPVTLDGALRMVMPVYPELPDSILGVPLGIHHGAGYLPLPAHYEAFDLLVRRGATARPFVLSFDQRYVYAGELIDGLPYLIAATEESARVLEIQVGQSYSFSGLQPHLENYVAKREAQEERIRQFQKEVRIPERFLRGDTLR
ncbi:MAG: hypothetical protein OEO21_02930 [Candidatus Krumholzibacteria bacterium]|nr:hypothetical protein [Candidatus Krumholzibacteria bacterium]